MNYGLKVIMSWPLIRTAQPQRTVSGIHRLDFFVLLYQDKRTREKVSCNNTVIQQIKMESSYQPIDVPMRKSGKRRPLGIYSDLLKARVFCGAW